MLGVVAALLGPCGRRSRRPERGRMQELKAPESQMTLNAAEPALSSLLPECVCETSSPARGLGRVWFGVCSMQLTFSGQHFPPCIRFRCLVVKHIQLPYVQPSPQVLLLGPCIGPPSGIVYTGSVHDCSCPYPLRLDS